MGLLLVLFMSTTLCSCDDHEPIDPNESPSIVRQFDTREEAEAFGWNTMGKLWVYEMSK